MPVSLGTYRRLPGGPWRETEPTNIGATALEGGGVSLCYRIQALVQLDCRAEQGSIVQRVGTIRSIANALKAQVPTNRRRVAAWTTHSREAIGTGVGILQGIIALCISTW